MNAFIKFGFLIIAICLFSSCATLLNSKTVGVKIVTSQPARLVVQGDTQKYSGKTNYLDIKRSKKNLIITAFNDSTSKTISVRAHNSFAYWLNAYPSYHLWTGFIIDRHNPKRYAYPKDIYIDLAAKDSTYLNYIPVPEPYNKYTSIIKIAPLKLFGLSNPAFEIGYEKKTSRHFSTGATAGILTPSTVWNINGDVKPNTHGFNLALEERFYFKRSAPKGGYISIELNYLQSKSNSAATFSSLSKISDSTFSYTLYRDTFNLHRRTTTIYLKFGHQLIQKRFTLDFGGSIGPYFREIKHTGRQYPNDQLIAPKRLNQSTKKQEGSFIGISVLLYLRFGWTF